MKNRVKRLKNNIYRVHRSDLWGFVILRYKNDKITRFILKNFEYLFIKSFLMNLRNVNNRSLSDWLKKEKLISNGLINDAAQLQSSKIVFGYSRFMPKKKKDASALYSIIRGFNFRDYIKPTFNMNIIKAGIFIRKKSLSRNYVFEELRSQWYSSRRNRLNTSNKEKYSQSLKKNTPLIERWLKSDPTFIRLQKITPFQIFRPHWWRFRMLERKLMSFYCFSNVNRFRQMQKASFSATKLRTNSILYSEGLLCVVLFRLNLFTSMYFIINFIKSGNVLVNGRVVRNTHYVVSLLDDISIKKDSFAKIFNSFWVRLTSGKILLNVPNYIISNYKIMTFSIWRYPSRLEVIAPYDFPFDNTAYDLSTGRRKPAFNLGP